jgi:hypothetical protein
MLSTSGAKAQVLSDLSGTTEEDVEKHFFCALRFLHPSKPKPGLPGTPGAARMPSAERICLFSRP